MKKGKKVLLVLAIIVMAISPILGLDLTKAYASTSTPQAASIIKDKNLENVIRKEIKKPKGNLTMADLARVKKLNAAGKGIKDLKGIENCYNIVDLRLENNKFTEINMLCSGIGSIRGLEKIKTLCLDNNSIGDIGSLMTLNSLENLSINSCMVEDISPLSSIGGLSVLRMEGNRISDISPLAELTELSEVYMRNNQITDIRALAGKTKLIALTLDTDLVTDLTPIADLYQNLQEKNFEIQ